MRGVSVIIVGEFEFQCLIIQCCNAKFTLLHELIAFNIFNFNSLLSISSVKKVVIVDEQIYMK